MRLYATHSGHGAFSLSFIFFPLGILGLPASPTQSLPVVDLGYSLYRATALNVKLLLH